MPRYTTDCEELAHAIAKDGQAVQELIAAARQMDEQLDLDVPTTWLESRARLKASLARFANKENNR